MNAGSYRDGVRGASRFESGLHQSYLWIVHRETGPKHRHGEAGSTPAVRYLTHRQANNGALRCYGHRA